MATKRSDYADEERVAGTQARALNELKQDGQATRASLDDAIARAEALAAGLHVAVPAQPTATVPMLIVPPAPALTFDPLAAAAPQDAGLHDALAGNEIEAALARLHAVGRGAQEQTALDRWDWVIAGAAGLLAGVADLVLVGLPQNPITYLGAEGGPLSNAVRSGLERVPPPHTVKALEKAYKVPYDRATNHGAFPPIPGLSPNTHRFQSPGHDPLLGWVFGVQDVLNGTFTSIGQDGVLTVQQVAEAAAGQGLFSGLLEAFQRVGGHMLSDVSTPMGLPAPLMPLAQFLQFGEIGPEGHTIAETARRMYLQGYDFRHFVAGGLATAIVEIVVRGAWVVRRRHEGREWHIALPDAAMPRLRRQLLFGHATAAAVNAGKVAVLQNPLALNWAQWLALLRYLGPELAHLLHEPAARAAARDDMLDADLQLLLKE